MKYYKVIEDDKITMFGKQANNVVPSFSLEITAEEYQTLKADFDAKQALITDYVEKVTSGEMTIEEVPEEYYQEVYDRINEPKPVELDITQSEEYMAGYDQAVLDMINDGIL